MTHFSSYLFFRFIKAFKDFSGMQSADVAGGETQKIEVIKAIPWSCGTAGIIKFNRLEYLVQIRPIFSQIKVEKPLMYSDVIRGENHDK